MFRAVINSTPMTSDAANDFFQHINGDSYNRDVSFLSTLRALVSPRMKENEGIYLRFSQTNYSSTEVSSIPTRRMVPAILNPTEFDDGMVFIHNFGSSSQEDNYACLELMKSSFESTFTGWHRLEKVTDFFRKTFYVLCFVNPDKRSVAVFTDNMDIRKMHYLQCGIFAFLPWYFDPNAGVSADEMALIKSLREKDAKAYEDCIAKIAEKYDFKTAKIKKLLGDFETRFERIECDKVRRTIADIDNNIESYNNYIADYLRQRREEEIRLLGLETKIASGGGDSEIMDYFLSNNKLSLEAVTNDTMTFVVKDYITYFDEDMAKTIIDKDESYVYRPSGRACNNYILAEDMKKLMLAIFIDQTLRIRVCACYEFRLGQSVRGISDYRYSSEFREYTPNPHIDRYSCMGSYSGTINKMLKDNNYIGAIEQCVASCKSLNFADSTVMCEFMCRIYGLNGHTNKNMRCIELPDGTVVTPKEAIEWMKAQEAESNE